VTQENIILAFASVYWAALQEYKNNCTLNYKTIASKRFKTEFKSALKWLLKHCGTLIPPKASNEAIKIAKTKNIDLLALQWKDQPKAEELIQGKRGRNIFVHEHEWPVSLLYNKIIESNSQAAIINILKSQSIVWITKEENKKLHIYKRNEKSYETAGIIKNENPYKDDWMEKPWNLNK